MPASPILRMIIRHIGSLYLLFLLGLSLPASGQDVGFYLNEMNTHADLDSVFNARIDTIYAASDRGTIDSSNYHAPVAELYQYFDEGGHGITGDKAELYAYFILFKHRDYPTIIDRFEDRRGEYNHRNFTTIGTLYHRSYMKLRGGSIEAFQSHLDSLAKLPTTKDFNDFLTLAQDLQYGQAAPSFTLTDAEGKTHDLESLRGKVILLDFWATWCIPCIKDIPEITSLHDRYRDNDKFVLISISLDTDAERWKKFIAKHDLPWLQARDFGYQEGTGNHSGDLATRYNAIGLPKYILIDGEGYIRYNSSLNGNKVVEQEFIARYL